MEDLMEGDLYYSDQSKDLDSDEIWGDLGQMIPVEQVKKNWEKLLNIIDTAINDCNKYDALLSKSLSNQERRKMIEDKQIRLIYPFFMQSKVTIYQQSPNELWYKMMSLDYNSYKANPVEGNADTVIINKRKMAKREEQENFAFLVTDITQAFDNINAVTLAKYFSRKNIDSFREPIHKVFYHWINMNAREVLYFDGSLTVNRSKGLPQGSAWTPLMWTLFLSKILKEHNLGDKCLVYADNLFFPLRDEQVDRAWYILKEIEKTFAQYKIKLNVEESAVIWMVKKPGLFNRISKKFIMEKKMKILGYNYVFDDLLQRWQFEIRLNVNLYLPYELHGTTFKTRVIEVKKREVSRHLYQLIGFILFGDGKYDLSRFESSYLEKVRLWLGMKRWSYANLITLDIDPIWSTCKLVLRYILFYEAINLILYPLQNLAYKELGQAATYCLTSRKIIPYTGNPIEQLSQRNPLALHVPNWINDENREKVYKNTIQLINLLVNNISKSINVKKKDSYFNIYNLPETTNSEWKDIILRTKWILLMTDQENKKTKLPVSGEPYPDLKLGDEALMYESYWYITLRKRHENENINYFMWMVEYNIFLDRTLNLKNLWTAEIVYGKPEVLEDPYPKYCTKLTWKNLDYIDSFLTIIYNYKLHLKKRSEDAWNQEAENAWIVLKKRKKLDNK